MDDQNNIMMTFVEESPNIVQLEIRSRYVNRKTYRLFIDYTADYRPAANLTEVFHPKHDDIESNVSESEAK